MINAIDGRIIEKISTVPGQVPTVAPSFDHTDGTWSATDIYEGEFFINTTDEKVFTRCGSTIVEISPVTPPPGLDDVLSIDNTTGANNIQVNTGQFIKYITQPALQVGFDDLTVITKKFVDDSIAAIPAGPTPRLGDVLAVDNTTGANDIIINDLQRVKSSNSLVYQEFSPTTFEQRTTDNLLTPSVINLFQNVLGYIALQTTNVTAGNYSRIALTNTQLDIITAGTSGATLTKISSTDAEIQIQNETESLIKINADGFLIEKRYTPTSSADTTGTQGQVTVDDNYIYVKTSTGWKRSALTSF